MMTIKNSSYMKLTTNLAGCFVIRVAVFLSSIERILGMKTCYKDEEAGEYDWNKYTCPDSTPECCTEGEEFTCCQTEAQKTLYQQLQLWGGVVGFILLVTGIYLCYRKDTYLCEKSLKDRCNCGKKPEEDEEKGVELSVLPDSSMGSSIRREGTTLSQYAASQAFNNDLTKLSNNHYERNDSKNFEPMCDLTEEPSVAEPQIPTEKTPSTAKEKTKRNSIFQWKRKKSEESIKDEGGSKFNWRKKKDVLERPPSPPKNPYIYIP